MNLPIDLIDRPATQEEIDLVNGLAQHALELANENSRVRKILDGMDRRFRPFVALMLLTGLQPGNFANATDHNRDVNLLLGVMRERPDSAGYRIFAMFAHNSGPQKDIPGINFIGEENPDRQAVIAELDKLLRENATPVPPEEARLLLAEAAGRA